MSVYISFFGKSQDFTAKYYDKNGSINDFNQIIKDFHLLESKILTVDDINNKEILARYYFKIEAKAYCLVKLYSFAQALNGNRVAGSIYGVGLISEKNIDFTSENLNLLREAKDAFTELSTNGLKFNKSNFSEDTYKIWNAIANGKNGNLLEKIILSEPKFNGTNDVISFFVKDLFNDSIRLNDEISKNDIVYLSEDIEHLKRTQKRWGKDYFPIFTYNNGIIEEYKEQIITKDPITVPTGDDKIILDQVVKVKLELADCDNNNKILQQNVNKLKKKNKKNSSIIFLLILTILLLIGYILFTIKKKIVVVTPVDPIHDTIYKSNISSEKFTEINKQQKLAFKNDTNIYIFGFNSKKGLKDTVSLQKVIIN